MISDPPVPDPLIVGTAGEDPAKKSQERVVAATFPVIAEPLPFQGGNHPEYDEIQATIYNNEKYYVGHTYLEDFYKNTMSKAQRPYV